MIDHHSAKTIEIAKDAESVTRLPATLEERSHRLALVCRAAAALARDRLRAGLPAPISEPWPPSTLEFLAKNAPGREKSAG